MKINVDVREALRDDLIYHYKLVSLHILWINP